MKLIDIIEKGTTLKKGKTEDRASFLDKINHLSLNFKNLESMNGIELCKNLVILDLSENSISSIPTLYCKNLRKLYLQNNSIAEISGLQELPLEILNLSCNQITFVSGLESLLDLEILLLDCQNISSSMTFDRKSFENLKLKQLSLIGNYLQEIDDLTLLKDLEGLNISNNNITSMNQMEYLVTNLPKLSNLHVMNNPITQNIRLFERLVAASDCLQSLNDKRISANTRTFIRQKMKAKISQKTVLESERKSPKPIPHLPPYATQYRDLLISQLASAAED